MNMMQAEYNSMGKSAFIISEIFVVMIKVNDKVRVT